MYYGFGDYVSVAEQRKRAEKDIAKLRKKGESIQPVEGFQGQIAKSFWGKKWCENLEYYADEFFRLDRGRRYIRAGSICHFEVKGQKALGLVSGSRLYRVSVEIRPIAKKAWAEICARCSANISSQVELLSGRLDKEVMQAVCDVEKGLFPRVEDILFTCTCPDSASMCKHVAAIMYAIGRKLDDEPELIFRLRNVDPEDMISKDMSKRLFDVDSTLDAASLEEIFGIELDSADCELAAATGPVKLP